MPRPARLSSLVLHGTVYLREDGVLIHVPDSGGPPRRWEPCPVLRRWTSEEAENLTPQQRSELPTLLGSTA